MRLKLILIAAAAAVSALTSAAGADPYFLSPNDADSILEKLSGSQPTSETQTEIVYSADDDAFNLQVYADMKAGISFKVLFNPGVGPGSRGKNAEFWLRAIRQTNGRIYTCPFQPQQGFLAPLLSWAIGKLTEPQAKALPEFAGKYHAALFIDKDGKTLRKAAFFPRTTRKPC